MPQDLTLGGTALQHVAPNALKPRYTGRAAMLRKLAWAMLIAMVVGVGMFVSELNTEYVPGNYWPTIRGVGGLLLGVIFFIAAVVCLGESSNAARRLGIAYYLDPFMGARNYRPEPGTDYRVEALLPYRNAAGGIVYALLVPDASNRTWRVVEVPPMVELPLLTEPD